VAVAEEIIMIKVRTIKTSVQAFSNPLFKGDFF